MLAVTVPAGAVVVVAVALLGEVPWLGGFLGHGLGSSASFRLGRGRLGGGVRCLRLLRPDRVLRRLRRRTDHRGGPVAALVSTVLPVGVAIADGERLTATMVAGALLCLAAIVLVSMPPTRRRRLDAGRPGGSQSTGDPHGTSQHRPPAARPRLRRRRRRRLRAVLPVPQERRAVRCALAGSGLRTAGTLVAFGIALATRTRPWRRPGGAGAIALISGAVDAAANVCYVLATRAGLFGLAVVITSLYPGVAVLLARVLLGERMCWLQRAGLLLAALGVVMVIAYSPLGSLPPMNIRPHTSR